MAIKRNPLIARSQATNAYDLLTEIINLILAEPKRYDQRHWLALLDEPGFVGYSPAKDKRGPECGTIGCVAGWTVMLKGDLEKINPLKTYDVTSGIMDRAQEILDLTSSQADELFSGDAAGDWGTVKAGTLEHAQLGAAHIRRFQARYKEQLEAKAL